MFRCCKERRTDLCIREHLPSCLIRLIDRRDFKYMEVVYVHTSNYDDFWDDGEEYEFSLILSENLLPLQGSIDKITCALIPYIEDEIGFCDTHANDFDIVLELRYRITTSLNFLYQMFKMNPVNISGRTRSHRFTLEFPAAIDSDLLDKYVKFSLSLTFDWYDWINTPHIVSPGNENLINSFMSACLRSNT
jgi:hypothetical protein